MIRKFLFLLSLLFGTSLGSDICDVLFVIDGSKFWKTFKAEIISVSTNANILYSSSNPMIMNVNFWMYGDSNQVVELPTTFYSSKDDFLAQVGELQASGGNETIVGATSKLNKWSVNSALIALYTASPENLIKISGQNYTEYWRTIVIHQNDGVEVDFISDYPSPGISDYSMSYELIEKACLDLVKKKPSSTLPLSSTTRSGLPLCRCLLVIDGTDKVDQAGSVSFLSERNVGKLVGHEGYFNAKMQFTVSFWMYGNATGNEDIPTTFIPKYDTFADQIDALESYHGTQNFVYAVLQLNPWEVENPIIILFTASPQNDVDAAALVYNKKGITLGIPLADGVDLSGMAAVIAQPDDFPAISQAVEDLCLKR